MPEIKLTGKVIATFPKEELLRVSDNYTRRTKILREELKFLKKKTKEYSTSLKYCKRVQTLVDARLLKLK